MTKYLILALSILLSSYAHSDWRTADRSSANIAPSPYESKEAIVHVYVARTFNWHKYLAVHSWVAFKEKNAEAYEVYHVIGWQARNGGKAVVGKKDIPDRKWYGNIPELITDIRGKEAEAAIPQIKAAILSYKYPNFYRMYPGPNSNSFVSHIIRNVNELQVELPANAVGKDWVNDGDLYAISESGTGVQVSVFGLLGLTLGLAEGIELNLLGLSFGVDILRPAVKLPAVGRLGFKDAPVFAN
ncbi:MAG: DUF3750 domain-containing protein [Betaproteobacteria bacterium]|nr:DUF3750 domain-containing protein [Betaproteobacteria bacterium]